MRNLKKILALVLVLVMSMSLVSVAGAKYTVDQFSDSDKIAAEYEEAVAVLTGLGLLRGDANGVRPEDPITRAEVATLCYRIMTGDDSEHCDGAKKYADYGKFEDVPADYWGAGMINFCANNHVVEGYNPTTFGPEDYVTGYQAVLMMLRAIGWDETKDPSELDWRFKSLGLAQKLDWSDMIDMNGLDEAAPRQVVAYLTFKALTTPQFTYTPGLGFDQDDNLVGSGRVNDSLGFENFDLAYTTEAEFDAWGRPFHVWFKDDDGDNRWDKYDDDEYVYAMDVYERVEYYTEATPECDIAADLGIQKSEEFYALYVNGVEVDLKKQTCDEFDGTIDANKVKSKVGAQGRLTEIYKITNNRGETWEYVMVMTDEFLAVVDDVTPVIRDKNQHIEKYAALYLTVYYAQGESTTLVLESEEDWEYKENDVLRMYAETVSFDSESPVRDRKDLDDVYHIFADATEDSEISKQIAYSTEKSHYLISLDESTPDAVRYGMNEAGNNDTDMFTWYFDSYGNVLGSDVVTNTYVYGTIASIQWVDSYTEDADGYAIATLIDMDNNTQSKVKLTTIVTADGKKISLDGVEGKTNVDYVEGLVSSTKQHNKADYVFEALYVIDVDAKTLYETKRLDEAQLLKGVPELTPAINATKDTKFLINESGAAKTGLKNYTGISNIGTYTAATNVWYVDTNNDAHAEFVFGWATPKASSNTGNGDTPAGSYTFFAFDDAELTYKTKLDEKATDDIAYWEIAGGYVDGKLDKIKIQKDDAGKGLALRQKLMAAENKGLLWHIVKDDSGYVTSAEPVDDNGVTLKSKAIAIYAGKAHKSNGTSLIGDVLIADGASYNVEKVELEDVIIKSGTLKATINHDEDAHLYLIFNVAANNDEEYVDYVFVTNKGYVAPEDDGTEDDTPVVSDPVEDAKNDLDEAIKDLENMLGGLISGLNPSWTVENEITKGYDAIDAALIAISEALDLYEAAINASEKAASYAETLANYKTKITVTIPALVEDAKEALTIAVAKAAIKDYEAAVAACEAEMSEDNYELLIAACAKVIIAKEMADDCGADISGVVTSTDDSILDVYGDAAAEFGVADGMAMGAAREEALDQLKNVLWNAVKNAENFQTSWGLTKGKVAGDTTITVNSTTISAYVENEEDVVLAGLTTAKEIEEYVASLTDAESTKSAEIIDLAKAFVAKYIEVNCSIEVKTAADNADVKLTDADKTALSTTAVKVPNFKNLVFTVAVPSTNKTQVVKSVTYTVGTTTKTLLPVNGKYTIPASALVGNVDITVTLEDKAVTTSVSATNATVTGVETHYGEADQIVFTAVAEANYKVKTVSYSVDGGLARTLTKGTDGKYTIASLKDAEEVVITVVCEELPIGLTVEGPSSGATTATVKVGGTAVGAKVDNEVDLAFTVTPGTDKKVTKVEYKIGAADAEELTAEDGVYTIAKDELTDDVTIIITEAALPVVTFAGEKTVLVNGNVVGTTVKVADGTTSISFQIRSTNIAKVTTGTATLTKGETSADGYTTWTITGITAGITVTVSAAE